MAKHQETSDPTRLLTWLEANKDTDKVEIDGILQPLVKTSMVEFRGYVPEADYNLALLYECPFAGGKTEIANFGARLLINNPLVENIDWGTIPSLKASDDESRLFRARVPEGTLKLLQSLGAKHKFNGNQLATLVVRAFHTDPGIIISYQEWEARGIEETGLSIEEFRNVCFARYRVEGVTKRYNLAKIGDPEAAMEKML